MTFENEELIFNGTSCVIFLEMSMINLPFTGEGKDRPSLSPIPVAYVYVPVYVYMLTEIC